jgi:hypothetical protein
MAILMNNPKNSTDSHLLVLLASQPISSICSWGPIEFGGAALRTQKLLGSGLDARPGNREPAGPVLSKSSPEDAARGWW